MLQSINSPNGPPAWCRLLAADAKTQKLTLLAKLLFALSNNSSIPTAFEYRLTALCILPNFENNYINLTIGTYESLRKNMKMSALDVAEKFGTSILPLVANRSLELQKFSQFTTVIELCYTATKQVSICADD